MWLTSLIVFDLRHAHTRAWLDTWYAETQEWSSQDQLSFPYVAWAFRDRLCARQLVRAGAARSRARGLDGLLLRLSVRL